AKPAGREGGIFDGLLVCFVPAGLSRERHAAKRGFLRFLLLVQRSLFAGLVPRESQAHRQYGRALGSAAWISGEERPPDRAPAGCSRSAWAAGRNGPQGADSTGQQPALSRQDANHWPVQAVPTPDWY